MTKLACHHDMFDICRRCRCVTASPSELVELSRLVPVAQVSK